MKRLTLTICTASLILFACNNDSTKTAETKGDSSSTTTPTDTSTAQKMDQPMDSAAMMKAWEAYMTPGDVHKMLAKADGVWTGDITMWMSPDAPPQKTVSTSVNKMILGGRYQESKHTGNMMGMPFEGMSTVGYDNATKKFVSTWIDNMGTGIMNMEGTWDDATKTISLKGKMVDPMSGKEKEVRETMKFIDDNNQYMEMFDNAGGKEYKSMEIKYTRKK